MKEGGRMKGMGGEKTTSESSSVLQSPLRDVMEH